MSLKQTISHYWEKIQGTLFPILEQELSPLTQKQQQLASVLEVLRIEEFVFPICLGFRGRPEKSRRAILRAFVAKSVYDLDIPYRDILTIEKYAFKLFSMIEMYLIRLERPLSLKARELSK